MSRTEHAPAILGLMVLLASASLGFAPPAYAQGPDAGALVELVPPGTVVADGTPVQLSVLALDTDGTPLQLIKPKLAPSAGKVGKLEDHGGGRYGISYTPPADGVAQDFTIVLSARTPAKAPITRTFHLQLRATGPGAVSFSADPPAVTLGDGATSTLSLQVEGTEALDASDLEFRALAGSVANVAPLGQGRISALYTAPSVNFPHLDIVSVVDRRDPDRLHAQLVIPLVGRADFPVNANPGASVLLTVGEREFGPVLADAAGKAKVPIEVPPGIGKATVTTPQGSSELDLGIPPFTRAAFLPSHPGLPGEPTTALPLRLVVASADGAPDAEARPRVTASEGTVSEPVYEGQGVFRVDYTPPVVSAPTTVVLRASLPGGGDKNEVETELKVVPTLPARVSLDLEGEPGGPREAQIHALSANGLGIPGLALGLGAVGATVSGSVRDLSDGRYAVGVVPKDGPMELWVDPACEPTGNPAAELLLFPTTQQLAFEGWTSTILTVLALDSTGHPVPGVTVDLGLLAGDGTVPATATTAGCGLARVGYSAGEQPGLAIIRASADELGATTAILQGPAAVVRAASVGTSGTQAEIQRLGAWAQRLPVLRVASLPEAMVAVAPAPAPAVASAPTPEPDAQPEPTPAPVATSSGPIVALELVAEPARAAPGSELSVVVTATDAAFLGVPGRELELLSSVGGSVELTDLGDGRYRATIEVPKRQSEPVKVTVSTPDGGVVRFLKVPVGTEEQAAPAPAPEPVVTAPEPAPEPVVTAPEPVVTAPEPVVTTPPPAPKEPRSVALPWLRLRAAGGVDSYAFEYLVSETPRTLEADGAPRPFEQSLVLEGADRELVPGGTPSNQILPAVDLRARAWVPALPYLGADLRYRGAYLGVDTDSFAQYNEGIDLGWWDSSLTAVAQARYFHDLGEHRLWAGAAFGTITTAMPLPAYWSPDGGEPALWFFPWGFTSLYGGLRGGAELGFGLDIMLEANVGTERWTGLFLKEQTLELGYAVGQSLSVNLVLDRVDRGILVPMADEEPYEPMVEVFDQRVGAKLGLGMQF